MNNEFTSVGVSCMDSGILLCGHPYGGCGILYRKSLSPYVKNLHTGSNRFCSIKLCDSVGTSFLLICVYLPTDFKSSSFTDYLNALGELEGFIDSQYLITFLFLVTSMLILTEVETMHNCYAILWMITLLLLLI